MPFARWVDAAGNLLEGVGVASIVVGAAVAAAAMLRSRPGPSDMYRGFRQALGKAILLGLE